MSPLNRKTLRDLWQMKGQAVAIALVIGCGVALFVLSRSMLYSLELTQNTYYQRYHFADVFASLKRAPDVLLCDEPTGALDVHTGVLVLEAIQRINRELGTTTAVITHNAVIGETADRVIHLSGGIITGIDKNSQKREASELTW